MTAVSEHQKMRHCFFSFSRWTITRGKNVKWQSWIVPSTFVAANIRYSSVANEKCCRQCNLVSIIFQKLVAGNQITPSNLRSFSIIGIEFLENAPLRWGIYCKTMKAENHLQFKKIIWRNRSVCRNLRLGTAALATLKRWRPSETRRSSGCRCSQRKSFPVFQWLTFETLHVLFFFVFFEGGRNFLLSWLSSSHRRQQMRRRIFFHRWAACASTRNSSCQKQDPARVRR